MKRSTNGIRLKGLFVSGDVTLVDSGDGAIGQLVRTAAELFEEPGFAPAALVGGLAVTIRLATAHRSTVDVDAVAEGEGPRDHALRFLGDTDAATTNRLEILGVNIDVLDTWPLPVSTAELPEDELDRLFVLGHRWALDSHTRVVVGVVAPDGLPVAQASSLPVATVPALLSCKLHALCTRWGATVSKNESDALDVVRLIGEVVRSDDPSILMADAPFDLAEIVKRQVELWCLNDSLRMARLASSAGSDRFTPDEIRTLGHLFLQR